MPEAKLMCNPNFAPLLLRHLGSPLSDILASFSARNQNHLIHKHLSTTLIYLYFSVGAQSFMLFQFLL